MANSEHGRTLFAPTDYSGEFVMPQNRYARCWGLLCAWSLLCSALPIPHSSFLTPHFYLFSPQHQYPDNIRHCHKSIENIRHSPHKLHAPHRSNAPTSYRHDPIDHIASRKKVSPSPLPYETPPCHCRSCNKYQRT